MPDGDVATDSEDVVCVPEACGSGPWREDSAAVAWVAPWGDDEADGTAEAPFADLLRGLDAAAAQGGGTVQLAAGTWSGTLSLGSDHDDVVLEGRCPELTWLDGGDADEPTVWVKGGTFTLRHLTITGGDRGLGVARDGFGGMPHGVLRDVVIDGSRRVGMLVTGSEVQADLRDVTIRNSQPLPDGSQGRGIELNGGAQVFAEGLVVEGCHQVGIFLGQPETRIELERSVVRGTLPDGLSGASDGISMQDGGELFARDLRLEDNRGSGISVSGGGTAELQDTLVIGTVPSDLIDTGAAVNVGTGGHLVARGLRIEDTQGVGIFADSAGASVVLEGVEIIDVRPRSDGSAGEGAAIQDGVSLIATDLRIERTHDVGIVVRDAGTTADLLGLLVQDVIPSGGNVYGQGLTVLDGAVLTGVDLELIGTPEAGILVKDGASVSVSNVRIHDNGGPELCGTGIALAHEVQFTASDVVIERFCGIGVKVEGPASLAELSDVRISDLINPDTEPDALGLLVYGEGHLIAQDVLVERAGRGGMLVWGPGNTVDLERVVFRDTDPTASGGLLLVRGGRGIEVNGGSLVTGREVVVEGTAGMGLNLGDAGTSVTLVDSAIRGTWHDQPGEVPTAIHVQTGSSLTATRLEVADNEGIGLSQVSEGTSVTLVDSQILDTKTTAGGTYGMGLEVIGGTFSGTELLLSGNAHLAFLASSGAQVWLEDSEIRDVRSSHEPGGGSGLGAQLGAEVVATRLVVSDTEAPGAFVSSGASLRCEDCTFVDNDFAGLALLDGSLDLVGGSVRSSRPGHSLGGGVGLLAWRSPDFGGPPRLSVDGTTFGGHPGPALYLRGSGGYEIVDARIEDSATLPGVPGAVIALENVGPWDAASALGLLLDGVSFASLPSDAIVLDGSSGTLDGNSFSDVGGFDLFRQHCEQAAPLQLVSGSVSQNDCAGAPYVLDPALWFAPVTDLIVVVE